MTLRRRLDGGNHSLRRLSWRLLLWSRTSRRCGSRTESRSRLLPRTKASSARKRRNRYRRGKKSLRRRLAGLKRSLGLPRRLLRRLLQVSLRWSELGRRSVGVGDVRVHEELELILHLLLHLLKELLTQVLQVCSRSSTATGTTTAATTAATTTTTIPGSAIRN